MASRVFPNTVYVSGFPRQTSYHNLLRVFGGKKGHIADLQFMYPRPGEPEKAFIEYSNASSVSKALMMHGKKIYYWEALLDVREVDEEVLCEHVPGEKIDMEYAFENLQSVLRHVLNRENSEKKLHSEILSLQMTQHLTTAEDALTLHKAHKDEIEHLTAQLTDARAQLETSERGLRETQAQRDGMRISLAEAEARLKTAQDLLRSNENERKILQQRLEDSQDQKDSTMRHLGETKIAALEDDLKATKDKHFEARSASDLRGTQSSLDATDVGLRTTETRADNADKKRERAAEWLADECETKRRLVLDSQEMEARHQTTAQEIESGYVQKLETIERMLSMEVLRRKAAEEHHAQAKSKLDQGIVTDALLAAFIKMENWTVQVLREE